MDKQPIKRLGFFTKTLLDRMRQITVNSSILKKHLEFSYVKVFVAFKKAGSLVTKK